MTDISTLILLYTFRGVRSLMNVVRLHYRTQGDTRMATFFNNNFSEERWRKAALKNAYSLLSKQRFEHAAAFLLLAGSFWDAIQLCINRLKDIQMALVISRLYENENMSYKGVLTEFVVGRDKKSCPANKGEIHVKTLFSLLLRVTFKPYRASSENTTWHGWKLNPRPS